MFGNLFALIPWLPPQHWRPGIWAFGHCLLQLSLDLQSWETSQPCKPWQCLVWTSVGRFLTLMKKRWFWFQFWLVKTELEVGLILELEPGSLFFQWMGTKLELGSWFFRNWNWNWIQTQFQEADQVPVQFLPIGTGTHSSNNLPNRVPTQHWYEQQMTAAASELTPSRTVSDQARIVDDWKDGD